VGTVQKEVSQILQCVTAGAARSSFFILHRQEDKDCGSKNEIVHSRQDGEERFRLKRELQEYLIFAMTGANGWITSAEGSAAPVLASESVSSLSGSPA